MDPGTALAVASLVNQCLQAFQFFVDAAKLPEASRELLFWLDIEYYTFKIWSKIWGISIETVAAEIQFSRLYQDLGAGTTDEDSPILIFCAKNIRKIIELLTKAEDLKLIYSLDVEEADPRSHSTSGKPALLRKKTLEAVKRMN